MAAVLVSFLIAVAKTLIRSDLREDAFVLATVCQSGRGVWTRCLSGWIWCLDQLLSEETGTGRCELLAHILAVHQIKPRNHSWQRAH